jgi:hypothetical protein
MNLIVSAYAEGVTILKLLAAQRRSSPLDARALLSLQANRRRHAEPVSDFRKNSVKVSKHRQELGCGVL